MPEIIHGRASTYQHHRCRCDECTAAKNAANQAAKARRREYEAALVRTPEPEPVAEFDVLPTLGTPLTLADGLCAEVDPELFFPDEGSSPRQAMSVCRRCDVRDLCLQWALETDQRFGVWGGVSMHDRDTLGSLKVS